MTTQQEIENMITMIGCNKKEFLSLIEGKHRVSFSSGSWYTDFTVYADRKLIARYDCKGNRKEMN